MIAFFCGMLLSAWMVGGLWFWISATSDGGVRLPWLNARGAVALFLLCGPLTWVVTLFQEVDWEAFASQVRALFVDLEAEKIASEIEGKKK